MEKLIIDGGVVTVNNITENNDGFYLECDNGCEYIAFDCQETAGEAARQYWVEMAEHDKEEFKCMVGTDNLIAWGLGEYAGPGTTKVQSLDEWLELWLDTPAEQWASYDGEEIEGAKFNKHFENATGFTDRDYIVLYRCN